MDRLSLVGILAGVLAVGSFGAEPKQVLTAGAGEGPAWNPELGLLFSGGGKITRLGLDGKPQVYRDPSGGSNGLLWDAEGRLVVCEAGNRRVTRMEKDGTVTVLADNYEG